MRSLRSVLTTRGRAFMGSGAVLVLAGVIFGFRDLTRFGVLLVALPLISAVLVRTRKTRMRIERHSHPERISVGQDAHVTLSFENVSTNTTPIFLAEERLDYVLGDRPRFVVGRIPPGRVRAIDYAVRSHLRGRHHLGPLGVQVQDPFGLANRNAVLEGTADLVVLPAVHPLSSNRQPSAGVGSEGEQAHLIALHGEDDVTIREYRDGDDLRRIHWPATARTGDLMVRQEDRPAQRRAVVLIDPRPSAHGGTGVSSSFEWAITAAASVAVHLCDSGYAVHLVCAETVETSRAAETMTPEEILDVLAVATTARRHGRGRDPARRPGARRCRWLPRGHRRTVRDVTSRPGWRACASRARPGWRSSSTPAASARPTPRRPSRTSTRCASPGGVPSRSSATRTSRTSGPC